VAELFSAIQQVLCAILEQMTTGIEDFNGTESGTELLKTGWGKRG
jgi:hypothetical protein